MANLKNTTINNTEYMQLPVGTTAQRPGSPVNGDTRFNSQFKVVETYMDNAWKYMPAIVESGLVLHLDAAEPASYSGSGTTWSDLSGNGYTASIQGTNRYTSLDGGKFDFRGISNITDYIILPHEAAQVTSGAYTLMFWMQPQSNGTRYFHSMHNGSDDNYNIMQITTSIQGYLGGLSISFSNDEWLQLSLVRNGSDTASMYKNTESPVSSTQPDISAVTSGGWILNQEQDSVGGSFSASQNAHSAFSVILLYNRALSASEIQQNFNALRGRYSI